MKTVWLGLLSLACAHARQVAVTIDDLPVAQSGDRACEYDRLTALTRRILAPLAAGSVPVTAFVIANNCPALTEGQRLTVLRMWQDAGAEIGNHTWSHVGLNRTPIADYEQQILRADAALKSLLGLERIRYFRSPMLQAGRDEATRVRLEDFLREHGYRQAPVTFDNSDWMFAYVFSHALAEGDSRLAERGRTEYVPYMESVIAFFEQRSVEVAGREFPQVLLIHANELNARMLPDLLAMLKRRGYEFVSLEQALRDEAYQLPNRYAGPGGFSWIHRWSMTKGMPNKGEPDEPQWLRDEYKRIAQP